MEQIENFFWPVVGIVCYIVAIWWDGRINMKQEDIVKSYFKDDENE